MVRITELDHVETIGVLSPLPTATLASGKPTLEKIDYDSYDQIVVAFSGGKDSTACVLTLIERGVDMSKVELWHHDIDGQEGSTLMDWTVTRDYCRKFAEAFDLPIYFSWLEGGFEREMLRDGTEENGRKSKTWFETPDGLQNAGGGRGKPSTRRKFPQVSANLSVRWCSAYLKIDVGATAIRNQKRFNNSRTLFITGERAEESAGRAKYAGFEPHRSDNRDGRTNRHVDQWRPVHQWSEEQVWNIIKRHNVATHPAYDLGFGRVSCMACIFGSDNQWATIEKIAPTRLDVIKSYEIEFNTTIHRTRTISERIDRGTPYEMKSSDIMQATSEEYQGSIIVDNWTQPAGAFGESCGPT